MDWKNFVGKTPSAPRFSHANIFVERQAAAMKHGVNKSRTLARWGSELHELSLSELQEQDSQKLSVRKKKQSS